MKRKLFLIRYLLFFVTVLSSASIFTGCSFKKDNPIITYTVSFKTNSSTVLDAKKIEKGKAVTKPDAPSKSGYTFEGWYTTASLTGESYNFGTAVTEDLTLYAKFTETTAAAITLTALKALVKACKKDNAECEKLKSVNTSNITDMSSLFDGVTDFDTDISSWDISKVTDMAYMFNGATSFNQPLNDWDTTEVTNMNGVFYDAKSFNQPLNSWETNKVTTMEGMFFNAKNFNQSLNDWDVSNVTSYDDFETGSALVADDLPVWN